MNKRSMDEVVKDILEDNLEVEALPEIMEEKKDYSSIKKLFIKTNYKNIFKFINFQALKINIDDFSNHLYEIFDELLEKEKDFINENIQKTDITEECIPCIAVYRAITKFSDEDEAITIMKRHHNHFCAHIKRKKEFHIWKSIFIIFKRYIKKYLKKNFAEFEMQVLKESNIIFSFSFSKCYRHEFFNRNGVDFLVKFSCMIESAKFSYLSHKHSIVLLQSLPDDNCCYNVIKRVYTIGAKYEGERRDHTYHRY